MRQLFQLRVIVLLADDLFDNGVQRNADAAAALSPTLRMAVGCRQGKNQEGNKTAKGVIRKWK